MCKINCLDRSNSHYKYTLFFIIYNFIYSPVIFFVFSVSSTCGPCPIVLKNESLKEYSVNSLSPLAKYVELDKSLMFTCLGNVLLQMLPRL